MGDVNVKMWVSEWVNSLDAEEWMCMDEVMSSFTWLCLQCFLAFGTVTQCHRWNNLFPLATDAATSAQRTQHAFLPTGQPVLSFMLHQQPVLFFFYPFPFVSWLSFHSLSFLCFISSLFLDFFLSQYFFCFLSFLFLCSPPFSLLSFSFWHSVFISFSFLISFFPHFISFSSFFTFLLLSSPVFYFLLSFFCFYFLSLACIFQYFSFLLLPTPLSSLSSSL